MEFIETTARLQRVDHRNVFSMEGSVIANKDDCSWGRYVDFYSGFTNSSNPSI